MIVMKFGGTSVKNAAMMKQVASILGMYNGQVLVVLSATSGTTDTLYKLITLSQEGQLNESIKLSKLLKNKHFMIMNELGLENDPDLTRILNELFSELSLYLRGISYLQESSNKVRDAVASTGELISTHIFSAYLKKIYPKSIWFDARKVLRTNNQFGSAIPDMKKIPELCKEKLLPAFLKNRFVITQGFIGSTED